MATRTLDHASVRINNVQRSRKFYEGILGLAPVARPELGVPGMWYGLGEAQLHLIESQPTGGDRINPTDPHFAIEVDDLHAMRRQLKETGIEMLDFGAEQLWVKDPDGNTVELRAPARPSK